MELVKGSKELEVAKGKKIQQNDNVILLNTRLKLTQTEIGLMESRYVACQTEKLNENIVGNLEKGSQTEPVGIVEWEKSSQIESDEVEVESEGYSE